MGHFLRLSPRRNRKLEVGAIMAKCGQKTEVYSRCCGYYRPVQNWNAGKKSEFKDRLTFDMQKAKSEVKEV